MTTRRASSSKPRARRVDLPACAARSRSALCACARAKSRAFLSGSPGLGPENVDSRRFGGPLLRPRRIHQLAVALLRPRAADGDERQAVRAGFERADDARRDAHEVEWLQRDDL